MYKNSKIFITFLCIAIFVIMYSYDKGQKQIAQRKDDYTAYTNAAENINKGKDLKESLKIIENLEDNYVKIEQIEFSKIQAYTLLGEFDKAENSVKEAMKLNKKLENDSSFLLIYANICIANNEKEKAKQILEHVNTLEKTSEQQQQLDKLNKKVA